MSSVSCVASTAPWPARAWSEWPCVISARSTGRVGSMWKSPIGLHSPEGIGRKMSSGRMAFRYAISAALLIRGPRGAVHHLRRPDRRPPLRNGARLRGRGRSRAPPPTSTRRPRNSRPGSPRPGSRSGKRARRSATARARAPRSSAPRPPTPTTAMARRCALRGSAAPTRRRRRCTATCARCSTSTRRASTARSRTSPIRRLRCCARR